MGGNVYVYNNTEARICTTGFEAEREDFLK